MSVLPNPLLDSHFHVLTPGPSMTSQLPAKEADINTIVGRFLETGVLPPAHRVPLELEDLTSAPNLQQLLQASALGHSAWLQLPQALRDKVGPPANLFPFLEDPDNVPFLERLGILTPQPPPEAPPKVVPPAEPAPAPAPGPDAAKKPQ